ncbi:hypothetical protein H9Q10_03110 [Eikenella sp. S3360]|uniref:Uncharacterized protein n=1 Tax=Eikenella glucosivorans TaxID=2766967 RepID=A0ABS0N8L5_9NEIS|nr:hypothetical protein [Eikenella glucosivorans]MBH5328656.1 hypothetical protein [Eikenella glucosivorans]
MNAADPDFFDDYSLGDFASDLAEDEMDYFLQQQLQAEEDTERAAAEQEACDTADYPLWPPPDPAD